MFSLFRERLAEALQSMLPLVGCAGVLQLTIVHAPLALFVEFLVGSVLASLGLLFLFMGVELGILPMGRFIGAELPGKRSLPLIFAVAFALGVATTVAEPDVLVLSGQVEAKSQGAFSAHALSYVIAGGVGLLAALALWRIVRGYSLRRLLAAAYSVMLLLTLIAPAEFVPLAYDAGSVTTGVLTTPVLLALAFGLSSVLAGRSAVADGFGLLGLASIGPILAVLLLGMMLR